MMKIQLFVFICVQKTKRYKGSLNNKRLPGQVPRLHPFIRDGTCQYEHLSGHFASGEVLAGEKSVSNQVLCTYAGATPNHGCNRKFWH